MKNKLSTFASLALLSLFMIIPYHSLASESPNEFKEIDLRILPALEAVRSGPAGYDTSSSIGGQITYFIKPWYAINLSYQYSQFSPSSVHRAGGGPLFRPLDMKFLRAELEAHANYVRTLGQNHFGWGATAYVSSPIRHISWVPFLGPFVSYDYTYLGAQDLKSLTFGLMLAITGNADFD